ncbi:MAG: hypothetical protein ACI4EF_03590 [Coprococcus sp.]
MFDWWQILIMIVLFLASSIIAFLVVIKNRLKQMKSTNSKSDDSVTDTSLQENSDIFQD